VKTANVLNALNTANHKISKKGSFGTTMGVASIIAILVILVLIVFAALSLTTAKADLTLSEKTAEATTDYYRADAEAEDRFAELAAAVKDGAGWKDRLGDGFTVTDESGGAVVSYSVANGRNKELAVRIRVASDGTLTRELWQVRSTDEWQGDNDIQLIIE
jgi:hypothetical protein